MAPQGRIPLHQMRQQKCFSIPRMGVFEMCNAKKCAVLAWRSKHACLCTKNASKGVFGYLEQGCLKCAMPKNVGVLARCSKGTYLCTKYASKSVFGYLGWGCLHCTTRQKFGLLWWLPKMCSPTSYPPRPCNRCNRWQWQQCTLLVRSCQRERE